MYVPTGEEWDRRSGRVSPPVHVRSLRCAPADARQCPQQPYSVGVFTELDGRRFALTLPAGLLRSDAPGSMRALGRMYGSEQYRSWGDLLESVRPTGPLSTGRSPPATSTTWRAARRPTPSSMRR